MSESLENQIRQKRGAGGFIKVTDGPVSGLTSEQKALLNRKGNVLFNDGKIEEARRIFTTTGYSDGLTRIGDKYMEQNEGIKALKQYFLAHNQRKADAVYERLAAVVSAVLKEPQ